MKLRSLGSILAVAACLAVSSMAIPGHAGGAPELDCSQSSNPKIVAMSDDGIGLTSSLLDDNGRPLPAGRYALPENANAATTLVVMFHGHQNDSCSWRNHLRQAAARGAIAVAMDYSGTTQTPMTDYGWPVRSGAADSIAAAKYFLANYPITKVIAFGVSMGGNVSGFAVAAKATRANGSPLFDYWVDVEGVNNLLEEYAYVRVLAPGVGDAAVAQAEIEEENGGPIESNLDAYTETTNVLRAPDMASLKGAIVVNGFDDSLVPTEQSPEMAVALNAVGVPTHEFNVIGSGGAESGSTYSSVVAQPLYDAAGLGAYNSPLAGHGWEGSDTQLVMKTGLEQVWALVAGGTVSPGVTPVPGV